MTAPHRILSAALALAIAAPTTAQVPTAIERVADIRTETGPGTSSTGVVSVVGSTVILSSFLGSTGTCTLHATDGTPGSLVRLDVQQLPYGAFSLGPDAGPLFAGMEPGTGVELWTTDGTSAGTRLVADLAPGPPSGFPLAPVLMGGIHYFDTQEEPFAYLGRLWRTDGTTAGTWTVSDVDPLDGIAVLGSSLIFGGTEASLDSELWISDGTAAGTTLLKDIQPGPASSEARGVTTIGARVVFSADDGVSGVEPWVTDGTEAGTTLLRDIQVGSAGGAFLAGFRADGARAFFTGDDGATGREPWLTDGTSAGTVAIADIRPGPQGSDPGDFGIWNGSAWFAADDGVAGREVWTSDGTGAGTRLVADLAAGATGSWPTGFTPTPWGVVFVADDGISGRETWITDGTPGGTRLLADSEPGLGGSNPFQHVMAAGKLYFRATTLAEGEEPWVSDGTPAGSCLLADVQPPESPSDPLTLMAGGGRLQFLASDGPAHGQEPWSSDGTQAGTSLSADIAPGEAMAVNAIAAVSSDRVFGYSQWPSVLWSWPAAGGDAERLGPMDFGFRDPPPVAATSDGVFFPGNDAVAGAEPFVSDGTVAGTRMLIDLTPGASSSDVGSAIVIGDRVAFLAAESRLSCRIGLTDLTDRGRSSTDLPRRVAGSSSRGTSAGWRSSPVTTEAASNPG